jgi:hypothetical protein
MVGIKNASFERGSPCLSDRASLASRPTTDGHNRSGSRRRPNSARAEGATKPDGYDGCGSVRGKSLPPGSRCHSCLLCREQQCGRYLMNHPYAGLIPVRIAPLRFPADCAAQYAHLCASRFRSAGADLFAGRRAAIVSPATPSSHQTRCEPGRTEQIRLSLSHISTDRF